MPDLRQDSAMNEIIPNWLDNPQLSHVLACSLILPTGESQVQVAGTDPANQNFARAMKRLGDIAPLLLQQGLLPGQMIWNFSGDLPETRELGFGQKLIHFFDANPF